MNETNDAAALFAPLWKRKWMILIVAVLVAALSYFYYKRQPEVWSATTQLNLASGSEEQGFAGASKTAEVSKAALSNSTSIITSTAVATEARKLLGGTGKGKPKATVRAKTSTSGSDVVTITVEAGSAKRAARVANAYALAYIKRTHQEYVRSIQNEINSTHQQLRRIELAALSSKGAKGSTSSGGTAIIQAAALSTKLNELETALSLQGVQQITPATPKGAELIEPKPKQNAIFGFVFGLLLASIAAFVAERLDHSLRSVRAIESAIGAKVITALPHVRNPVVDDGGPRPSRPLLEPLRRLNAMLVLRDAPDQARVAPAPRVLLVTSANAGDGKSTLAAGLALVKRAAGERVALVEADFDRPVLARMLRVNAVGGLADALTGRRPLEDVLVPVPVAGPSTVEETGSGDAAMLVKTRTAGSISVLPGDNPGGEPPPLTGPAISELIGTLSEDFDTVLIDAPSPVEASQAMPLLAAVDGIIVVGRIGHTQDASAARLAELLQLPATAPVLGAVANDVSARELAHSGFTTGSPRRRSRLGR